MNAPLAGLMAIFWFLLSAVWLASFVPLAREKIKARAAARNLSMRQSRWILFVAATFCLVVSAALAPTDSSKPNATATAANPNLAPAALAPADDYPSLIHRQATDIGENINNWVALVSDPQLSSDDWRIKVAAELAVWSVTYDQAKKLNPPVKWEGVNRCWLQALKELNAAGQLYAQGIDHNDGAEIREGNEAMKDAGAKVRQCNVEIDDVAANSDAP